LILQGCPVKKIIVKDGEARGVVLADYALYPEKTIEAKKAVVSDLTLVPTFINLVGEEHLTPELAKAIKSFNYDGSILFTAAYATREKPRFVSQDWDPDSAKAWGFNYGAESLDDIKRMGESIERGEIPDPVVSVGWSGVYTLVDPSQAPPGVESVLTWTNVPYDLKSLGGPEKWDEIRDQYLEKVTERLNEYAPNFKASIIASFAQTPLDVERRNPSAVHGCIEGGALTPEQYYLNRPLPGFGAPRTPIKKLYICNSIHPQATTNLAAGYNAACVVAEDLGVRDQPWWRNRPLEWWLNSLREKGYTPRFTVEVD
jgi:phytoene dehydrogenase-like protein